MSRSKVWFFAVCGVGLVYAAIVVYAGFNNGAVLPHTVDNTVRAILTGSFVVTALWCLIGEAEDRVVDRLEARIVRGLAAAGRLDDATGEIPRVRVVHTARAQLPADNVVAFELGRQSMRVSRDDA